MNTNYEIIDEYGYENYDYLYDVLNYTIKKLNVKNSIFDIIFIDDDRIHEINKDYRGIDRPTDVISFALNDNKKIDTVLNSLGDIFISIPRMKEQSISYNHSEKRELSFLAVHGLLHLLGYDHIDKILNELGINR